MAASRGLRAPVIGRPTTRKSAPERIASRGVATRDWSSTDALAGRTPGTTIRKVDPHARRIARASCAEATTPSSPARFARRARAIARVAGEPETPTRRSASWSMLVNIVTPSSAGRLFLPASASRAARIMDSPPKVWMFTIRTFGRSAAAETAPATVLGISWNLRSRNVSKPKPASRWTARGPSAVKS